MKRFFLTLFFLTLCVFGANVTHAEGDPQTVTPQSGSNISYTQTGQNSRIGSYEMLAQLPGFEKVIDKNIDSGGNGDFTLPKYIRTLVRIAIGVIGMLSVVMIVVAGVQYMASEMMTEKEGARQKLTGAVMGLILAVSSVLILRTINPQLLNLDIGKGILLDCVQAKDKDGNLLFYETTKPSTDPKAPPVVPRVIVEKKGTDGKKTYSFVGGGVAPTPTIIKYETEACDKSVVVAEEIKIPRALTIEDIDGLNLPSTSINQADYKDEVFLGYLAHQQGINGAIAILKAVKDGSAVSSEIQNNMQNNWNKKSAEKLIGTGDLNPTNFVKYWAMQVKKIKQGGNNVLPIEASILKTLTDVSKEDGMSIIALKTFCRLESYGQCSSVKSITYTNKDDYAGLFQFGTLAWKDFGKGGNRLDAYDNTKAAARLHKYNMDQLAKRGL